MNSSDKNVASHIVGYLLSLRSKPPTSHRVGIVRTMTKEGEMSSDNSLSARVCIGMLRDWVSEERWTDEKVPMQQKKAMRCRVEQIVETLREGYELKKEDVEESREYVKFLRETIDVLTYETRKINGSATALDFVSDRVASNKIKRLSEIEKEDNVSGCAILVDCKDAFEKMRECKYLESGTILVFDKMTHYFEFETQALWTLFRLISSRCELKYRWMVYCGGGRDKIGSAALEIISDDEEEEEKKTQKRTILRSVSRGLSLLEFELHGKEKFNGCETGKDGNIYFIPANARRVARLDPRTDRVEWIGPDLGKQNQKWLRGYLSSIDGCIYGVPCCSREILKIDTNDAKNPKITTLKPNLFNDVWMWHGGVIARDGHLYCVPANAESVLKVEIPSNKITLIKPEKESVLKRRQQCYGGLICRDGTIVCVPQNGERVIRIDPKRSSIKEMGPNLSDGNYKFHGGCFSKLDQSVYGIPNHANRCIRVVPHRDQVELFGDADMISSASPRGGRYKYEGGVVGPDGSIYFMPGSADRVLKVIPPPSPDSSVKPRCVLIGESLAGEKMTSDKYQNGKLGRDGCVYGIPVKARGVLRIDTKTDSLCSLYPEKSGPLTGLDKYQGGVFVPSTGAIYCVPFMAKKVLKIVPEEITKCMS